MRHMGLYLGLLWVSGVYGSSAEPEKVLKCIMGGKVIFPAAVKKTGFLIRVQGLNQIAKVMNKGFSISSQTFTDRVQWDSSTGLFSITGLKMEDSGQYKVQNQDEQNKSDSGGQNKSDSGGQNKSDSGGQNKSDSGGQNKSDTVYQLTVYNPVSTPQVSSRNKMKPTCSVLCSVENGREVTLSWQREGETLNSTSSPDLNTPLSLPLEIEENSAPYSCVATNPASNKTVTVKPEEFCFDSVSKPRITNTTTEHSRCCSVLCSVENGRAVTLSWQREGKTLNYTSSPDLNTPLSLLLEIEENSAPYSCVATNPVSNETTVLNTSDLCRVDCSDHKGAVTSAIGPGAVIGAGVGAAILFAVLGMSIYLKKRGKAPKSENSPEDLTYANINHGARRPQRENAQTGHSGASDDTVYSNVNHKSPKKQKAAAPRATQGESSCVYAEVRRK
ncbi:hypothetical protein AGOR_G00194860 [Albula goreensis]|uniref:Ig-like domain-containing protein n=1 Tax=Albula goreensis TaxID=1534307 RepID=A0A8T3CV02_9TELE|nr:hypothetical protein AGOR_G00194860 [Albula goreensis]